MGRRLGRNERRGKRRREVAWNRLNGDDGTSPWTEGGGKRRWEVVWNGEGATVGRRLERY
ncbi:MAG: hypothetical protein AB1345_02915 [Chloroflexota bacterium]